MRRPTKSMRARPGARKIGNQMAKKITKVGRNRGKQSRVANSSRPRGMSGGRGY